MYFENNIGMKKDGCSLFLNYSKTKNIEFLEELINKVHNRKIGEYPSKHIDQIEPRIQKRKWISSSVEIYSAYNNWLKEYFWLKNGKKLRLEKYGKWTKEACFEEAKKYMKEVLENISEKNLFYPN